MSVLLLKVIVTALSTSILFFLFFRYNSNSQFFDNKNLSFNFIDTESSLRFCVHIILLLIFSIMFPLVLFYKKSLRNNDLFFYMVLFSSFLPIAFLYFSSFRKNKGKIN